MSQIQADVLAYQERSCHVRMRNGLVRVLILLIVFPATRVCADVAVNELFSDHMVLQRDMPLPVWGTAQPHEDILVTLGSHQAKTKADQQGRWSVRLDPLPSGGPLTLTLAGQNTLLANFVGVVFGVFMYFPTLVEVPIANMFLGLGMHRGPLLAYLMADPELSIQSILITAKVIGSKKTWVYVGLVAVFSTLAGLIFGAWVDGASLWLILGYLAAIIAVLAGGLWLIGRLDRKAEAMADTGA